MRIRLILYLALILSFIKTASAQNHLVTHRFIHQKVAEGYFQQRPGITIPQDDYCISKSEAKNWLYLEESFLPIDDRMPWWNEIIPATTYSSCVGVNFQVCHISNAAYNSCGSWLYSPGFSSDMSSFTRTRLAPNNHFFNATPADQSTYCPYTPVSSKSSMMAFSASTAPAQDSGSVSSQSGMITPMALAEAGPLNRCAIWSCSDVGNQWLYVDATFTAPRTGTYYLGVGADNHFRVVIDGGLIVQNDVTDAENFRIWHVFPVYLTAGLHNIRLEGRNDGLAGAMGCEIYDNTVQGLENAVYSNDMRILFTTRSVPSANLCTEPTTYQISVYNQTYSSEIWSLDGLNGYALYDVLYSGGSDFGTFLSHLGSMYIAVQAYESCDLVLEVGGWEVGRQAVAFGYSTVHVDVLPYNNVDLTVRLVPTY